MKTYKFHPSNYVQSSDWSRRKVLNQIKVTFNIHPPNGKKIGWWQATKAHIIEQIQYFSIMSTDELYQIKLLIENDELPEIFYDIVSQFYNNKKAFEPALTEIKVTGKFEQFNYENNPLRKQKRASLAPPVFRQTLVTQ